MMCPIFHTVVQDPVMAADGHTYERTAIENWLQKSNRSPLTREIIPKTLVPNVALKQLIEALDEDTLD